MIPRASATKRKKGGFHPWVAVLDGARIMGIQFSTRQEAINYAERVAAWWPPGTFDADGRAVPQRLLHKSKPKEKDDHD